jgi:tRNA(Arg) A34 adenosine deaminase TadA
MNDVERFLKQAVALAVENVRERHGRPFGAVLVKDGAVVATGVNDVLATGDPTAHAELQAIRAACGLTGDVRLDGCVMVASGHPCPMCLTAMYLTGIRSVYCAFSNETGEPYGLSSANIYAELAKPADERSVQIVCAPVPLEGEHPYDAWLTRMPAGPAPPSRGAP